MSGQDYVNYIHWKSWPNDSFFRFSLHEANYFSADFDDVSILDAKFLEIGFGNGSLLSWAKSRGAAIYGIETLETSLERAKEKNIPLLSSDLGDNLPQFNEFFDVIAAYDVLEHLSIPEIIITLDAIAKMLKPGGELMLRFPNGQSPFGTLSLAILDQLTVCGPLTISRYKSKKPAPIGPLRHRLGVHLKSSMRVVTEWYLKKIFDLNCELGTNVVVRLTKRT
jgi:2-polyprenyl-3-methyl-5-hydroxy-6-metoxy-1,4-benzoquinol methylase